MTTRHESIAPDPATAGSGAARECAAIAADLERLRTLINDAGDRLMSSFNTVGAAVARLGRSDAERSDLTAAIGAAVTALQFQDMATQLTAHAQRRLDALQQLLCTLSADVGRDLLVVNPHPVHQAEMSSGSIDLF